MSGYIFEDFLDDKKNYRIFYKLLEEGGSDLVYKKYLDLDDEHTRNYWVMLINDMVDELTGLRDSMVVTGTGEYEEILEKITS